MNKDNYELWISLFGTLAKMTLEQLDDFFTELKTLEVKTKGDQQ